MEQQITGLLASGPHPSLGAHAATYGRLIGSWLGELENHTIAGAPRSPIEIHFGWVLEGRAVQDVWIAPLRGVAPSSEIALCWYGTTLRVFEPARESWKVTWIDPGRGRHMMLEGRRRADDIVQVGLRDGSPIRWTFSELRSDAFRWQAHVLEPDGVHFRLEVDIHARRLDR